MNKLFIKICGTCASGKSTIGAEIRDFLREREFDVAFYDDDDEQVHTFHEEKVNTLKRRNTKIVIETVQLRTHLLDPSFKTLEMPKNTTLCKE